MNQSPIQSRRQASCFALAAACGLLTIAAAATPARGQCSHTEQAKLIPSGAAWDDKTGVSVAVEGDTAVVGAYQDDNAGGFDAGSAYVFVRAGGVWTQQAMLTNEDGVASDRFGYSVAISGDTVVVGEPFGDNV